MDCLCSPCDIILNCCGTLWHVRQNVRASVTEGSPCCLFKMVIFNAVSSVAVYVASNERKNMSDEMFITHLPHYPVPNTRQPSICPYILRLFRRNSRTFRLIELAPLTLAYSVPSDSLNVVQFFFRPSIFFFSRLRFSLFCLLLPFVHSFWSVSSLLHLSSSPFCPLSLFFTRLIFVFSSYSSLLHLSSSSFFPLSLFLTRLIFVNAWCICKC